MVQRCPVKKYLAIFHFLPSVIYTVLHVICLAHQVLQMVYIIILVLSFFQLFQKGGRYTFATCPSGWKPPACNGQDGSGPPHAIGNRVVASRIEYQDILHAASHQPFGLLQSCTAIGNRVVASRVIHQDILHAASHQPFGLLQIMDCYKSYTIRPRRFSGH